MKYFNITEKYSVINHLGFFFDQAMFLFYLIGWVTSGSRQFQLSTVATIWLKFIIFRIASNRNDIFLGYFFFSYFIMCVIGKPARRHIFNAWLIMHALSWDLRHYVYFDSSVKFLCVKFPDWSQRFQRNWAHIMI